MNVDFLGILSLVVVIHIYLFGEGDRSLENVLNRLKYALALKNGTFMTNEFPAYQHLGIQEILQMQIAINDPSHPRSKMIEKFSTKYIGYSRRKKILLANLLIFIIHVGVVLFLGPEYASLRVPHLLVTFLLGMWFYEYASKVTDVEFTKIEMTS